MPRYSLRRLLVVVTVIACAIGFLRAAFVHFTHYETAENLARVDWLPESASNVSYYKSYNFTAYEFNIPEPDFKQWAWWDLEEIKDPVKVDRYTFFAKRRLPMGPDATPSRQLEQEYESRSAEVAHGLFYEYRSSSSGGVSVAYDRVKGRAYFQSNPR